MRPKINRFQLFFSSSITITCSKWVISTKWNFPQSGMHQGLKVSQIISHPYQTLNNLFSNKDFDPKLQQYFNFHMFAKFSVKTHGYTQSQPRIIGLELRPIEMKSCSSAERLLSTIYYIFPQRLSTSTKIRQYQVPVNLYEMCQVHTNTL